MSENERGDDTPDETTGTDEASDRGEEVPVHVEEADAEDRRGGADRAVEQFDETLIDLLSWVLDTETRARIYVYLRQHPGSTSGEVAEGTGLYPSTVREALAALNEEETVSRRKRQSDGAGNNPYEYTAIAPSELVGGVVGQIQDELNAIFNLDRRLGRKGEAEEEEMVETGPVTINVDEEPDAGSGADAGAGDAEPADGVGSTGGAGSSDSRGSTDSEGSDETGASGTDRGDEPADSADE